MIIHPFCISGGACWLICVLAWGGVRLIRLDPILPGSPFGAGSRCCLLQEACPDFLFREPWVLGSSPCFLQHEPPSLLPPAWRGFCPEFLERWVLTKSLMSTHFFWASSRFPSSPHPYWPPVPPTEWKLPRHWFQPGATVSRAGIHPCPGKEGTGPALAQRPEAASSFPG